MIKLALCFRSITGGDRHGDEQFAVHATGCADLHKERSKYGAQVTEGEFHTVQAAVDEILDPETRELGWAPRDVKVFPCCRTGPKEKKPLDPSVCPGAGQPFTNPSGRMYLSCPECGVYVSARRGAYSGTYPRHKRRK